MFDALKIYYKKIIPQLTNEEWAVLEQCFTIKTFEKGATIVNENEVCNYVYFIESGFTQFSINVNGKEVFLGFVGEGEYVSAYESFINRTPSSERLSALNDVTLILLSYDDIQMLYKKFTIFETFGRRIAEMLYTMLNKRSTALLIYTPEERYLQLVNNQSKLLQLIPQYMLASYLGVTPEHLSRLRKRLATKV
jgi:CRP/FNR family transcriptional regulator, anaerobic regulatory protein